MGRATALFKEGCVTALTLGLAITSYELFESRFLRLKRFFDYKSAAASPAVPTATAATIEGTSSPSVTG